MPKFAANLSMMFTEHDFLDRFDAAAEAGFAAVEYLFPYEHSATAIAERLKRNNLTQALFNLPPGDFAAGERGLAGFGLGLLVAAALLGWLFVELPRSTAPGPLGITRPTLIGVPLIWTVVAVACWRRRALDRLYPMLVVTSILLAVANIPILYSRSPPDAFAMASHVLTVTAFLALFWAPESRDPRASRRVDLSGTALSASGLTHISTSMATTPRPTASAWRVKKKFSSPGMSSRVTVLTIQRP